MVADQLPVERPLPRTSAVEGGAWSGVKRKAADLDGGGWWALVPLVSVVVGAEERSGWAAVPELSKETLFKYKTISQTKL